MAARTFEVLGMDCAHCAQTVEKGVAGLDGIISARVDFATARLHVEGSANAIAIRARVEALGYRLAENEADAPGLDPARAGGVRGFIAYLWRMPNTRLAVIGGGLLLAALVGAALALPAFLSAGLFLAATLVAGYPIARSGLQALLINRDFNINFLMIIAAAGAILIDELPEAATVVFLFAIGEALEGYTAERARDSLRSLMTLAPPSAIRLSLGAMQESVPVERLTIDELILIKPGERIPMDGVVTAGSSEVNQAPITGESLPVPKSVSDEVFAGTINGSGALTVRVTRLASDNTISRIIQLVEEAQSVRAPSQRMIDRFARWYTPAVVVAAALVASVPPLFFQQPFLNLPDGTHGWLYRALALLVIACPCALVISAPVTVISAITAAARRGVLIKGGAHLEALGAVRTFAFDKTGTLTRGQPVVQATRAIDCAKSDEPCADCDDVLALASALELGSAHPIARAVVGEAERRQLAHIYPAAEDVELLAGHGLRGSVNGHAVTVGSHRLFDADYPHDAAFCARVQAAEAQGQTTLLLADDARVRGYIAVADAVREDGQAVVRALKALGGRVIMLTGDHMAAAQHVAEAVGVDEVRAGLLPQDKVEAVRGLAARGSVAMVGDGINDTPALAAATVGIAMGGAGSAQALETAAVVLMADDLRQLPLAVRLSRLARSIIVQNVVISLVVKVLFLVLAVEGTTTLWGAILADVGMALVVTLNGMRPLGYNPPSEP